MLLDLCFKMMLPSITYVIAIWGGCTNSDGFKSLEALHCRAAKVNFKLPRDKPKIEVLEDAKWDSLFKIYKLKLAGLIGLFSCFLL